MFRVFLLAFLCACVQGVPRDEIAKQVFAHVSKDVPRILEIEGFKYDWENREFIIFKRQGSLSCEPGTVSNTDSFHNNILWKLDGNAGQIFGTFLNLYYKYDNCSYSYGKMSGMESEYGRIGPLNEFFINIDMVNNGTDKCDITVKTLYAKNVDILRSPTAAMTLLYEQNKILPLYEIIGEKIADSITKAFAKGVGQKLTVNIKC